MVECCAAPLPPPPMVPPPLSVVCVGVVVLRVEALVVIIMVGPGSFVRRAAPRQSLEFGTLNVECNMPLSVHQKKETPNQALDFKTGL